MVLTGPAELELARPVHVADGHGPDRVRVVVGPSRSGHGWSRRLSWASVSAGWLSGSSHAGAWSGSPPARPTLCGEANLKKIEIVRDHISGLSWSWDLMLGALDMPQHCIITWYRCLTVWSLLENHHTQP